MSRSNSNLTPEQQAMLSRWRRALMAALPHDHPVQDPTKAYGYDELERFERQLFDTLGGPTDGRDY